MTRKKSFTEAKAGSAETLSEVEGIGEMVITVVIERYGKRAAASVSFVDLARLDPKAFPTGLAVMQQDARKYRTKQK